MKIIVAESNGYISTTLAEKLKKEHNIHLIDINDWENIVNL